MLRGYSPCFRALLGIRSYRHLSGYRSYRRMSYRPLYFRDFVDGAVVLHVIEFASVRPR